MSNAISIHGKTTSGESLDFQVEGLTDRVRGKFALYLVNLEFQALNAINMTPDERQAQIRTILEGKARGDYDFGVVCYRYLRTPKHLNKLLLLMIQPNPGDEFIQPVITENRDILMIFLKQELEALDAKS